MENNQQQINLNVQDRLRALEAQQQINLALLVAFISTHPERTATRKVFSQGTERLASLWLSSPIQEDWIEQGVAYRDMLLQWFDQTIPPSK